jgi:hypothetical protein
MEMDRPTLYGSKPYVELNIPSCPYPTRIQRHVSRWGIVRACELYCNYDGVYRQSF